MDTHIKDTKGIEVEELSQAAYIKKHQNDIPTAKNLGFIPQRGLKEE